jgi:hypothetical protein
LRRDRSPVLLAAGVVIGLTVLIAMVLRLYAADDVRNAPQYLFQYVVLGLAWMRLAVQLFPMVGLHPRDDIFERRNRAAMTAWIGAMTGVALCYSGANIGNGPGWWVVVFSALLSTAALAGVWLALSHWSGLGDAVVVDRDRASAVRLGSALTACGLIFGVAVAGDWVWVPGTVADFLAKAWPAVPVVLAAIGLERSLRPRPEQPQGPIMAAGVAPAAMYLAMAGVWAYMEMSKW